ncbi:unnamed protein product [Rhizophagus irregularis]|uniref:Uncharacterized protein n=1 Tax=Rhizophagus irregularis TaxID=588596 RepID=A0A2I1FSP3_9GLOM|nr:hypothetical protein RhiirA4_390393 [Rhizophagus irregularis]CAB4403909.1 unnamed protein product [Rhizophagus irregularis]CAB4404579.1 unnamed protein product [Rhizophagus irregularis]
MAERRCLNFNPLPPCLPNLFLHYAYSAAAAVEKNYTGNTNSASTKIDSVEDVNYKEFEKKLSKVLEISRWNCNHNHEAAYQEFSEQFLSAFAYQFYSSNN